MRVHRGQLPRPELPLLIESFAGRKHSPGRRGASCAAPAAQREDFYGNELRGEILDTRTYAGMVAL